MRKRQIYMVELEGKKSNTDYGKNTYFIKNFQTAILLSLLENKLIAKWQFDRCTDELDKTDNLHIGRNGID